MPFTFAHPAILLPFKKHIKRHLSASALIIGCIVPDFEYFIRLRITSEISHSIIGMFLFNLPIGLLLHLLFHLIIKQPLTNNSPSFLKERLTVFTSKTPNYSTKQLLKVAVSILLGAISHVVWDALTHQHGFFVQASCFLQSNLSFRGYDISIYKLLQHFSTFIGFVAISHFIAQLPRQNSQEKTNYLNLFWLLFLGIILSLFVSNFDNNLYLLSKKELFSQLLVQGISFSMISLLVTCAVMK